MRSKIHVSKSELHESLQERKLGVSFFFAIQDFARKLVEVSSLEEKDSRTFYIVKIDLIHCLYNLES